ncbi:S9 family peptidase [Membranicola marinus]|uniref:S9 family peptidase n=1 Tax=Membranihabitans marinus TaxID=1227546 RepID=A0A953HNE4_9BACT|nr:S9 family peptidase [Membranihabitans marinus]MBY5958309.1 S9 family peptidase [Membranihabitans marinus]
MTLAMGLTTAVAQKEITLEDIWSKGTFAAKSIPGFNFMNDGRQYTLREGNTIAAFDITTGEKTQTIFDPQTLREKNGFDGKFASYTFSPDEQLILLATNRKQVYRRSFLATYYLYDRNKNEISLLYDADRQMNAHFSPDGMKIGFVHKNNLYYKDLATDEVVQITEDGQEDAIIHGAADWVYEEEFAITRTFEWSPDGRFLAWIRFDERAVPQFTMTNYRNGLYPDYETFKYPKVGEKNALVSVHLYDVEDDRSREVDILTSESDLYIPRIKWTKQADQLVVFVLNRHQNNLKLILANANNGDARVLMEESNKYYIDIDDNLTFLEDREHFLWTSEKAGRNQVYLIDFDGRKKRITPKNDIVTEVYGYDPARKQIYYQAIDHSPLQRAVFSIDLKGQVKKLTSADLEGWNGARFSTTFDYYVLVHATADSPPVYSVYRNDGKLIRVIEDNAELADRTTEYGFQPKEFFTFKNQEGTTLNGYMIKPNDFDSTKKYPVFMFLYGGPGSQQVVDDWQGRYLTWFQMLAQKGYIVACVDNRGTGGRGEEFKKQIYMNLGKMETADQIDAAKYLGDLPYIDPSRVGVFGWSYGGYMSTNLILHGNDVFKMAIAVAPVTNWRWYDTIYTERYMRTEAENEQGYHDYSPVYYADKLKGSYLLVHGLSDDNVHFQHAAEMARALIDAGKEFDTMYYPNDNHGISGPGSKLHLFRLMTNFIKENL